MLFLAIVVHIVAITSESGHKYHSTAVHVLDITMLCFYLSVSKSPSQSFCISRFYDCYETKFFHQILVLNPYKLGFLVCHCHHVGLRQEAM